MKIADLLSIPDQPRLGDTSKPIFSPVHASFLASPHPNRVPRVRKRLKSAAVASTKEDGCFFSLYQILMRSHQYLVKAEAWREGHGQAV
jgi:hypothetical protein